MNEEITNMINKGYKLINFKRNINLKKNEEFGTLEVKAIDGLRKNINLSGDQADEIERVVFNYLKTL